MEKLRKHTRGRDNLKDLGIDRRVVLKWIFKREGEKVWICLA
jgi:hypothetical protein